MNGGGRSKIVNRTDELNTTSVQSDSLDRGPWHIVMEEMETDMIDALDSLETVIPILDSLETVIPMTQMRETIICIV